MKTTSIRNILVPIDFSPMSIQAIETAKAFAQRFGAIIHLTHVHQFFSPVTVTPPMPPLIPYSTYTYDEEAEKRMARELNLLATRHGLSPTTTHLLIGAPAFDEICRLAHELPVDLIVTPTHGRTGLKHVLIGSTAERIVQHSPCPVLVTRQTEKQSKNGAQPSIRTILVPVDLSQCSLGGLRYSIAFAKKFSSRILVLHVASLAPALMTESCGISDRPYYRAIARRHSEKEMRQFLRRVKFDGVPVELSYVADFSTNGICQVAAENKVDLIIMATHGRTGLKHMLIGSTAEAVVRHAPCSVLVVPSHLEVRSAHLTRQTRRARKAGPPKRPERLNSGIILTRKHGKLGLHPFPERRKTNKFRESHLLK